MSALGRTFGIPEEWTNFECRHARFLDEVLPPLMDAASRVVARTMESEHLHERLVFMLGRHVPADFEEIFLLCANGYGIAALKLLRPMFERVVTMMYLIANPEKSQDFVDWLIVEQRKTLNLLKDEGDNPTDYLTPEEVEQIEANYQRVKGRFPKKQHSWTKLDLRSMAWKVGIGQLYTSLCHWPTLQIHTTLVGLTMRVEAIADGVAFKVGPQRDEADRALIGAHTCLLNALDALIRRFGLAVDIAPLIATHTAYWGQRIPIGGGGRDNVLGFLL